MRRLIAQLLWWGSIGLIGAGAVTTFTGAPVLPVGVWLGGGLAGLGLNTLLGGDIIAGPEARPLIARGQVVRGEVMVRAGMNDLAVGVCGADRVAAVRHGPLGKPKFTVEDGVANLKMTSGFLVPNVTQWEANLARNVLWDIDARSGLGNLVLDLSGLRLERISARTWWGKIEINLPARGYSQISLRSGAGDIEVRIPEQTGVRLHIARGALAQIHIENPRVQALDAKRYATPDFEQAGAQMEIRIQVGAGDVILA